MSSAFVSVLVAIFEGSSKPCWGSSGNTLWMSVLPASIVSSIVGLRMSTSAVSTDGSVTGSSTGWPFGIAFSMDSDSCARGWLVDVPVVSPPVSWLDSDKPLISISFVDTIITHLSMPMLVYFGPPGESFESRLACLQERLDRRRLSHLLRRVRLLDIYPRFKEMYNWRLVQDGANLSTSCASSFCTISGVRYWSVWSVVNLWRPISSTLDFKAVYDSLTIDH